MTPSLRLFNYTIDIWLLLLLLLLLDLLLGIVKLLPNDGFEYIFVFDSLVDGFLKLANFQNWGYYTLLFTLWLSLLLLPLLLSLLLVVCVDYFLILLLLLL